MNSAQAKRIVLVSVFVSGALASVHTISEGHVPDVKIGIGALVLAVFLLTLAEVSPALAGSFGLLVLISAIFAVGPETYNVLTHAAGQKTTAEKKGK